jgi:hypothetical protein
MIQLQERVKTSWKYNQGRIPQKRNTAKLSVAAENGLTRKTI